MPEKIMPVLAVEWDGCASLKERIVVKFKLLDVVLWMRDLWSK